MKKEKLSKAAASGAVALIFLVLGFQAAIFTGNVFRYKREHRVDTVYVTSLPAPEVVGRGGKVSDTQRDAQSACTQDGCKHIQQDADSQRDVLHGKAGAAPPQRSEAREAPKQASRRRSGTSHGVTQGIAPRQEPGYGDSRRAVAERLEKNREPELFQFDPNTVSREELVRLGFSEKQAQVIENYRSKGGKYNKKSDFAKMYVVDSAMFARLEPYIKIKKLNLNTADSAALITLRGIGPYYAHKILEYRRRLGGMFTSKEQLLEIDGFDADRLSGFEASVEVGRGTPRFTIWTAGRSDLERHPYIGKYAAKGIARFKSVTDTAAWTLEKLVENGIITAANAARLRYLDSR